MRWHYVGDDKKTQYGPIKEAELIRLYKNKTITSETYVWNGKTVMDWAQISAIDGLEDKLLNVKAGSTRLGHSSTRSMSLGGKGGRRMSTTMKKYKIGDQINVIDTANKLENAVVTQVKDDKIKIHYVGWPKKWDEWLPVDHKRVKGHGHKKRNSVSMQRRKSSSRRGSTSMASPKRTGPRSPSIRRFSQHQGLTAFQVVSLDGKKSQRRASFAGGASSPMSRKQPETIKDEMKTEEPSRHRHKGSKSAFSKMWDALQNTLKEEREIDAVKLMEDLEKVQAENARLRAEFEARGNQIRSLKDEENRKKRYAEKKEAQFLKKKAQLSDLEKMLTAREKKLMIQETDVNMKLTQVEDYKQEKSKLKHLRNEITTLEVKIRSQEELMSKNMGKNSTGGHHDPQALKDLQEMKNKIHAERDRLRKDQEKLSLGLNQVQKAKSQLLRANQKLEKEKANNSATAESIRRVNEDNIRRHKRDKMELQKAQMQLKEEQEKVNKESQNIAESKGKIKAVVEDKLAQFKKELNAARQKRKMEEESIQKKQKQLQDQQSKLDEKAKLLESNLKDIEQQRKQLMESANATFNERKLVEELSRRELELTDQISQVQNQKSELELSSRNVQKELANDRERLCQAEKDLNSEKEERKSLESELSECNKILQEMKEQALKHQVEKEVWENMNSSVRNERDKLQFEKQKLREEIISTQSELDAVQSKLEKIKQDQNKQEQQRDGSAHERETSIVVINREESNGAGPPPPFVTDAAGMPSFEILIKNLMSDRQEIHKQEKQVMDQISKLEEEDKLLNDENDNADEDDYMTPPEFCSTTPESLSENS